MGAALASTSGELVLAAAAFVAVALGLLGVALAKTEFGKAARRRRRLRQALARAERARVAAAARAAGGLSATEVAQLRALRARVVLEQPLEHLNWCGKIRVLWRRGYAGLIVAVLVGAFSMATHFGAYWLIAGGGWLGAIVVTVLSTAFVVAACVWIFLGLVSSG